MLKTQFIHEIPLLFTHPDGFVVERTKKVITNEIIEHLVKLITYLTIEHKHLRAQLITFFDSVMFDCRYPPFEK